VSEHDHDRQLLEQTRDGDPRALESLLLEHGPALEAFVRLRLGARIRGKESIRDVVQSVCVEVLRDKDGFEYRGDERFRAWLFKHALHKIINKNEHWQRECRDVDRERPIAASNPGDGSTVVADVYATLATPSRILQSHEAEQAFETAFATLPEDYREAITLHRLIGLSHAEIAERMNRSEGAVRNLVHRGIARLSVALDQVED
jgi:RNA polymerase sigma-70 factor (ECF subfamily)